jgi:hypothetical protein
MTSYYTAEVRCDEGNNSCLIEQYRVRSEKNLDGRAVERTRNGKKNYFILYSEGEAQRKKKTLV